MLSSRYSKSVAVFLCVVISLHLISVFAEDTGTITDITVEQTSKELNWQGVTGLQIIVAVKVEFVAQVAESTPTVFFSATIRKSGSNVILAEAGTPSKTVTNNTASVIEFEMSILISATSKAGPNGEVSLKKGDKLILSVEMYYYATGEIIKTVLATKEKTFYLLSSPPTTFLLFFFMLIIGLLAVVVILFLLVRGRRLD